MFYNTNRATKAALRERELAQSGQNIISHNEKLIKIQKQEKLKGLLITKFCRKYGITQPEKKLENEIKKFVEGERLTNQDLIKLEDKIRSLLQDQTKNHKRVMSQLNLETENLKSVNNDKNFNINDKSTVKLNLENTNSMPNIIMNSRRNITKSVDILNNNNKKKKYNNIYEELAALESEESAYQPKIKKIDFSKYGNEWHAMNIYSKLLFDQQNKEIALKEKEDKKLLYESLNKQIEEKNRLIIEDEKLDKEYKKILRRHNKKLIEMEKEKERNLEEQKLKIQQARLAQIEDNQKRKKLEDLKEKRLERLQILRFNKENEEIKKRQLENDKKRELALKEVLKENELRKLKLLEKLKKEKEENDLIIKEQELIEEKKENDRVKYFKKIEKMQQSFLNSSAQNVINNLKKEEEEENLKIRYYQREKARLDKEKEIQEEKLREEKKKELAKYLEIQIEEKRKNEEFENQIDKEQCRIFQIDDQKYKNDQKEIEKLLDKRNKIHLNYLKKQIQEKQNKENGKDFMSPTEYSMNYNILEKAEKALSGN